MISFFQKKIYLIAFHILRVPVCRKNVLNNVSSSPDLSSQLTYPFPEENPVESARTRYYSCVCTLVYAAPYHSGVTISDSHRFLFSCVDSCNLYTQN